MLKKIIKAGMPYAVLIGDDQVFGFKFYVVLVLTKNKDNYNNERLVPINGLEWVSEAELTLREMKLFYGLKKEGKFERKVIKQSNGQYLSVYEPKDRYEDFKLWVDTEKKLMEIRN